MDAAVQAFKDKMAEKAAAKAKVMEAIGKEDWSTVATHGINGGAEGAAVAEMQAMADAYVQAHPEQFVNVVGYVAKGGSEKVVQLIDVMAQAGMEEEVLKLTMFELANFQRQQIGVETRAEVRMIGKGN